MSQINELAISHAKSVLGEEEYKENKSAVRSIKEDFTAGFNAAKGIYEPLFDDTRKKYEGVLDEFSGVYSKWETPLDIAKTAIREQQSESYYSIVKDDVNDIIKSGDGLDEVMKYINGLVKE